MGCGRVPLDIAIGFHAAERITSDALLKCVLLPVLAIFQNLASMQHPKW